MTNEEIREALEQIHFCLTESLDRHRNELPTDSDLLSQAQMLAEEVRELFFTDEERQQ